MSLAPYAILGSCRIFSGAAEWRFPGEGIARYGTDPVFSLKTHAVITGALLATMIVLAIAGNVLHDRGYLPDSSATQFAARVIFFALFLAFGFSRIPTMLKFFLAGQIAIGNGDVTIIRAIAAHQAGVVIGVWLFLALGLAIALPAALRVFR
jgi:uncharacterized membrane protein